MDAETIFKETVERDAKYVMQSYGRLPLLFVSGKGAVLKDVFGKEYIDCVAGIAVNATGYGDKRLSDAIADQASELIHISNLYYNIPQTQLAEKIVQLTGMSRVFFGNSGAEAMEAAIKLAKLHTGKSRFIAAKHAFHGRTVGSLGLTSTEKYRVPFEPLVQSAVFVEYGNIKALEEAVTDDIAAIVLEPIQGEGGVHVPTKEYLQAVRRLCDEKGILLIFDEVQTGFGRTGKWFCKDNFDVQPDIMTMAKAIAGGLPMGAITAREGLSFDKGQHASTFGGSPLVCAAALASIRIMEEDNLIERSEKTGEYFRQKLSEMSRTDVKEIRGKGLMIGIEMDHECGYMAAEAQKQGVLINVTSGNVIRLVPPLVITKEQIDRVVSVIDSIRRD